jgi:CDP-diacylglycerol--serine O-phosphatidyltransferase
MAGFRERLVDPRSPDRRPRRAAYALPTLFTAGNIFLGYIAILRAFRGAIEEAAGRSGAEQFAYSAVAIGVASFLDGLDGRIARLTNTVSEFGREMDSLADVISFGLAPAVLAYTWGVQFAAGIPRGPAGQLASAGYFIAFIFLLCGAVRLARFNIQKNPIPKNPGRPDRKYFVGLPIPAAAAMVAAVVYASGANPIRWWPLSVAWLALLAMLSFLMVSTWRYYSFKSLSFSREYSTEILLTLGILIYLIWNYSQIVLLGMAIAYVGGGITTRIGGILRRRLRKAPPAPEHELG